MSAGLRAGTRRSPLALAQTALVVDLLAATGASVEVVPVTTAGDASPAALTSIGGTGVFAGALREALLAGSVDLAVHSLKDLPVAPAPGLVVAAVLPREEPWDVLIARDGLTLAALPAGAVVGTGSPRRAAQLRSVRAGLVVTDVRGNVDTRLAHVTEGRLDAVVLAYAGLARLGRLASVTEVLDPGTMLPAPGQGAIAVECRAADLDLVALLAGLDDAGTRACVTAERALLAALEAGCTAPVGALATIEAGDRLLLRAAVGSPGGTDVVRRSLDGPAGEPDALAARLAAAILAGRGPGAAVQQADAPHPEVPHPLDPSPGTLVPGVRNPDSSHSDVPHLDVRHPERPARTPTERAS